MAPHALDPRLSLDRPKAPSHTLPMQRRIETLSLFMLLAIVVLRPLVAESYDSAASGLTAALDTVRDPAPVRTYVFDLLVLCATGGWLFARAVGRPRPYRVTGLGWGAGLILIAALVSCAVAGQKRLAVNGAIDWLCYPVLTIALVQLMHKPWHRRLVVAAVLASATVQAATCLEQSFTGFDDTWEHYLSIKDQFWAKQGVELDSNQVEAFERRMNAREATGSFPHSNVAASYLVLCAMAAAGLVLARARRARAPADRAFLAVAACAVLLIGLASGLAKSVGATATAIAGLILWLALTWKRPWVDAHRKKVFVIGWCCIVAGILATVGYGLYKDRPGRWTLTYEWQSSIMFRWQYWRASAGMIADHPLTGVGRENFGRHYLEHKLIESPEEIANPHNLFVQVAADWGIFGLVGLLAMLGTGSYVVTRCRIPQSVTASRKRTAEIVPSVIYWAIGLTLVVVLGRLPLLGTDNWSYLYYTSVVTGVVWLLGFVVFAYGAPFGGQPDEPNARVFGAGVAIGLFTFLAHDMINFATFVPGSATTFFALLAVCIAEVTGEQPITAPPKIRAWRLPLGGLAAAIVVFTYVGLVPVVRSARNLEQARASSRHVLPAPVTSQLPYHQFENAAAADPVDPTPYLEQAQWLIAASSLPDLRESALDAAIASIERAIRRDRYSLRLRRTHVRACQEKAKITGSTDDLHKAVDAAHAALALYPLDPKGMVALADCQVEVGKATNAKDELQQAIAGYERALKIDDDRLAWEELRRLRPKDREAIQVRIEQVQNLLQRQP